MKLIVLPGRDEIHAVFQQGEAAVLALFEAQANLFRELGVRNPALEDQHGKNSLNSGKQPASDRLNKPAPKSRREKSGKASGGNKGMWAIAWSKCSKQTASNHVQRWSVRSATPI